MQLAQVKDLPQNITCCSPIAVGGNIETTSEIIACIITAVYMS